MSKYKALFLTSGLGNYMKTRRGDLVMTPMNNANFFVDRLKELTDCKIRSIVYIPDSPDSQSINAIITSLIKNSFNYDGFGVTEFRIVDHTFTGNIAETINNADLVYLGDGNVLEQNRYFKEIGLRDIIRNYQGIILAEGAGMVNCAHNVYYQPPKMIGLEQFIKSRNLDKLNPIGLGLIKANIIPHLNVANTTMSAQYTVYNRSLQDSYTRPHMMMEDGAFIEVKKDTTVVMNGRILKIKGGKAETLCKTGQMVTIPAKNTAEANHD